MQVVNYLQTADIKFSPIDIIFNANKKVDRINGTFNSYNQFKTIDDKQLNLLQKKKFKCGLIAVDTNDQSILDVDDMDEFILHYPKIAKKLNKECINYLSRNKRLPHFLINIVNLPTNHNLRYVLKNECADLLCGQWAWCLHNETINDIDRHVVDIKFEDIILDKVNSVKISKNPKVAVKQNLLKDNELYEIFKNSKYCVPELSFLNMANDIINLKGIDKYDCQLCKREHINNNNHPYLYEEYNGYYFGCRENTILLKPKINESFELLGAIEYKKLTFNNKYVEYSKKVFNENDTIILNSCAGTGKTTNTANQLSQYLKLNKDVKILSLVNYISLADQQIESFKNKGITLKSYKDTKRIVLNDHYVCCINSLNKLKVEEEELSNVVLYIDEVTSFIKCIVSNETIDRNLNKIYMQLIELIKKCKKVIVSDANITDNTFNLLKYRDIDSMIFINNEFKKFENINAIRELDENAFFERLMKDVKNNKYFLCGADSCETVTRLYNKCLTKDVDKFILITSKSKFKIGDASKQFKDKFVFYSPSIVTGVDFSIDQQQNQYIYIKGLSLNVLDNYQQSTRTRNMKELIYFQKEPKNPKTWESFESIVLKNKDVKIASEKIMNLCKTITVDDEVDINENLFFTLASHHEYMDTVLCSNPIMYFNKLLSKNGFITKDVNSYEELSKIEIEEQKQIIEENLNIEFDKFVKDEITVANQYIVENAEKLNMLEADPEILKEFAEVLTNEKVLTHYYNFSKLCKTNEYITERLAKLNETTFKCKIVKSTEFKIKLIREIEQLNNIEKFDMSFELDEFVLPDDLFEKIKFSFGNRDKTPTTPYEFKQYYVNLVKNIIGNLDIICMKRVKDKNRKNSYQYSIDDEMMKKYLFAGSFNDATYEFYDMDLLNKYGIIPQQKINKELCLFKK